MKFFIDTANLDQIKEAESLGILDGVTTNPSLILAAAQIPAYQDLIDLLTFTSPSGRLMEFFPGILRFSFNSLPIEGTVKLL